MSDTPNVRGRRLGRYTQQVDPNALGFGAAPAIFTSAIQWFRADSISGTDGSAVSSWAATVGTDTLVQASGTLQPLLKLDANGINNLPCVRFDGNNSGTGDYLSCASGLGAFGAITLMLVVRPLASETTKGIFQLGNVLAENTPQILFQRTINAGVDVVKVYMNSVGYRWTVAHPNNVCKVYFLKWTGTTWTLEVNGTDQLNPATAGYSGNGASLWLGNGYNGYSNCDLPELAIWVSSLSTGNQADATAYAVGKYAAS